MTKKEKISQYTKTLEEYKTILSKAEELRDALLDYDKNIINKRFFEKYFTWKDEKGEISKDWKGNICTSFHFCDKAYSFDRYEKRIFLAHSTYIEFMSTDRKSMLETVNNTIKKYLQWIDERQNKISELEAIDEEKIKSEIIAIYKKYNCVELWSDLLEDYNVKYPNEKTI